MPIRFVGIYRNTDKPKSTKLSVFTRANEQAVEAVVLDELVKSNRSCQPPSFYSPLLLSQALSVLPLFSRFRPIAHPVSA